MKHLRTDWQSIQDTKPIRDLLVQLHDAIDNRTVTQPSVILTQLDRLIAMCPEAAGSSIKADEPVFIVRAKDPVAPGAVRYWSNKAEEYGSDFDHCERVRVWAEEMAAYRGERFAGAAIHAPDAPELLPLPA